MNDTMKTQLVELKTQLAKITELRNQLHGVLQKAKTSFMLFRVDRQLAEDMKGAYESLAAARKGLSNLIWSGTWKIPILNIRRSHVPGRTAMMWVEWITKGWQPEMGWPETRYNEWREDIEYGWNFDLPHFTQQALRCQTRSPEANAMFGTKGGGTGVTVFDQDLENTLREAAREADGLDSWDRYANVATAFSLTKEEEDTMVAKGVRFNCHCNGMAEVSLLSVYKLLH